MKPSETPGSVARALYGWRATASVMLPIWVGVLALSSFSVRTNDAWQDLAFVVLVMITYVLGVLVVVPLFAFLIGRWLDRRTAPRGVRRSVTWFAIYGFGFAIVLVLLFGLSGLTWIGASTLLFAPTLAAAAGRLLVEVRGRVGSIVLWVTFALAIAVALGITLTLIAGRIGP